MSMIDIAVTRTLILALKAQVPPSRAQDWCWCPIAWPVSKGHVEKCKVARDAINDARLAGY